MLRCFASSALLRSSGYAGLFASTARGGSPSLRRRGSARSSSRRCASGSARSKAPAGRSRVSRSASTRCSTSRSSARSNGSNRACFSWPRSDRPVAGPTHRADAHFTPAADWLPECRRGDGYHHSHGAVLFSDHGGVCRTRTQSHAGTDPGGTGECATTWQERGAAQNHRSQDVCDGAPALRGPHELRAAYLRAPWHCAAYIVS